MTLRIAVGVVILGWSFAFANINAAEPGSDFSASAPTSLTRPDEPGHPLPERAVSARANPLATDPTGLDVWRSDFMARLDDSLARLQRYESEQPHAALTVTQSTPGEHSSPAPFAKRPGPVGAEDKALMIARVLEEHGLPLGLTSVVAVESAFNPLALSPKGARGLWQLMPSTARRYGLTIGPNEDERTNLFKSTNAAAAYLKDLFAQFRDWPLVLAAYNAGEDRVARAMARTGASDFWTLSRHSALPQETLQYVPAVLGKLQGPMGAPETGTLRSPIPPSEKRPYADRIAYATPAVRGN